MIILNKNNEILKELRNNLKWAKEIDICISYITDNGLKEIADLLEDKKVRVITTTDDYITTPKALIELDSKYDVRVIQKEDVQRGFHSKFIELRNDDTRKIMIGSLNLTHTALFNKFETVTFLDLNEEDSEFEYLWNLSLARKVKDIIDDYNYRFDIYVEANEFFKKRIGSSIEDRPNDMQIPALAELKKLRSRDINRALLWAATGTGKTYLSAFDARQFKFKKLLFIVHNRTIIGSAKKDYRKFFSMKNILELYTENAIEIDNSEIVFATEKTLSILMDKEGDKYIPNLLDKFDYIIFDEVHKLGPENIQGKIFKEIKNDKSKFILGMTATPNRSDHPGYLFSQFENVVGKINIEKAMELGLICNFKYVGVDVEANFNQSELNNNEIDLMIDKFIESLIDKDRPWWDKKYKRKIKGIIFTSTISESIEVARKMTDKGFKSIDIHSKSGMNNFEIEKNILDLQSENNDLNFLVTVDKFNEGVDIPKINTIGMFRFTNSSIIYTQQIGRGLRTDGQEEKYLNIIDLVGNQSSAFNRISGLRGRPLNPRIILESIVREGELKNTDPEIEPITNGRIGLDFDLTEIASRKIIDSLSKISFDKFFKERANEIHKTYGRKISLVNIEKDFGESIQLISSSFRENAGLNQGDKCWISILLNSAGYDLTGLTEQENIIIELFSWMPITTSSPKEKVEILKLLENKEANLSGKWYSYFSGTNFNTKAKSQLVECDLLDNFKFDIDNEILTTNINFKEFSKPAKFIFEEIKKYLEFNKDRNDFLSQGTWYTMYEISFLAGYSAKQNRGHFKRFSHDKHLSADSVFITNKIKKERDVESDYENEVLSRNEFLIGSSKYKDMEKRIFAFAGSNLFTGSKKTFIFNYIGEMVKGPVVNSSKTLGTNFNRDREAGVKDYDLYYIMTENKLTQRDYIHLKYEEFLSQNNNQNRN